MKFLAEDNFNYIEFSDLKFNQNINLNKNLQTGVNVINYKDYEKVDILKDNLNQLVSKKYETIKIDYCSSLIFNGTFKDIIVNYKNIIDIDNNLTFRRLFSSLIPKHQEYLINKYNGYSNLKNFYLFPASDLNFICLLYSLTIISLKEQKLIPLITDSFFEIFDNLTLTSVCKLLLDFNKIINFQLITFINHESNFMIEYSKFYDFNYIDLY